MFRKITQLAIVSLLSIFLVTSNALAFHKKGKSSFKIEKQDGFKKKDIQAEYCTQSVKSITETVEVKNDNQENSEKSVAEQSEDFDKEQAKVISKKEYFKISSSHSKEIRNIQGLLSIDILKDLKKIDASTPFSDILSFYCVQNKPVDSNSKVFNKTKVKILYNELATDNGLTNAKDPIGDEIYKMGLINLERDNLIYSNAQFIVQERNKRQAKKNEKIKKEKELKGVKDFIANKRPPLVESIDSKLSEFDLQIKNINNKYTETKIKYENFIKYFKEKTIETEDLLDLIDVSQKQIKDKAIELKKAKREFLNTIILDDLKSKYKPLKKIRSKNFKNYKKIQNLLIDIEGSKKKKCFQPGKTSRGCKPSFPDQWDRLKNSELNNAKPIAINIRNLSSDIDKAKINIENNIDNLIEEIEILEEELDNKLPIIEIVIGIIVFLVICGAVYLLYNSSDRRKREKEENESKFASLKNDFEGKFKDTSEQIKSVGRTAAKSQQSVSTSQIESAPVKAKTPEEIISSQYDELVSDYKEALEDFSKVAAFKQKWHGLALSRKERQDGTKTVLVSSSRAFEKAEIWCVTFSEKYFAFPGSSVKSNMATYMNLDFEKAGRDFKGVFAIASGSTYSTEPAVLRRGGAGFVVDRIGKISFPN